MTLFVRASFRVFAFRLSDQSWPDHYQSMRFQGAQSPESESYVRVTLRPLTLIDKPLVSPQPALVFVTKRSGVAGLSNDERHAKNELLVEG